MPSPRIASLMSSLMSRSNVGMGAGPAARHVTATPRISSASAISIPM